MYGRLYVENLEILEDNFESIEIKDLIKRECNNLIHPLKQQIKYLKNEVKYLNSKTEELLEIKEYLESDIKILFENKKNIENDIMDLYDSKVDKEK